MRLSDCKDRAANMRRTTPPFLRAAFFAVALSGGCSNSGGDKNCADFACQGDAQAWHNSHSNSDLDADNDGIACENLPNCAILASEGAFVLLLEETGETLNLSIQVEDLHAEPVQLTAELEVDGTPRAMRGHLTGRTAWLHFAFAEDAGGVCLQLDTKSGEGAIMSSEIPGSPPASSMTAFRRYK